MHKRKSEDSFVELDILPFGDEVHVTSLYARLLLTELSQQPRICVSIVYVKCTHFLGGKVCAKYMN